MGKTNRLYLIGRAGDEGDTPLYLGQAVILITSMDITLDMSEPVSAAPSARSRVTMSWGALKQWYPLVSQGSNWGIM